MNLTAEQQKIIESQGNIKINAVAGSGKTTTVIEYANTRPANSKILYIAFNKSVKLEAIEKFRLKGLTNVKVETAHSLAYQYIVRKYNYSVRNQSYRISEVADILNLQGVGEKHTEYMIANHINKFVSYFLNSDKRYVSELDYRKIVSSKNAKTFVSNNYKYIARQTQLFLSRMDKGEIEIIHDFYLKKFQLSNPKLNFDYILFDEGQDSSAVMLDIFLNQEATKVIVGDTHQQIYTWRHAVNSLEKADFKTFNLSTSFRFSEDIANLANKTIQLKSKLNLASDVKIIGKGSNSKLETKAIIARTNLGLLVKAIKYISDRKNPKPIYFEGNINSYTYADDGASLYDVLALYNNEKSRIKDTVIRSMPDLDELEDYIEKTEDIQLSMMVQIVKEYGNQIPKLINTLKSWQVENDEKQNAKIIFSTVHKCKGMEYDSIQLASDFISDERLSKLIETKKPEDLDYAKLNEEINLLYVAITRTKNRLIIPEELLPKDFPVSKNIEVIREQVDTDNPKARSIIPKPSAGKPNIEKEKAYSVAEIRTRHKAAFMPWTGDLDDELTVMFCEGVSVENLMAHFGRAKGGILSRIKKLELEELYGRES